MDTIFLKILALIIMVIDHVGILKNNNFTMRLIGRVSFPLFAFCFGMGMKYTRSKKKYMIRLFIFAIISSLPYFLFNSLQNDGFKLNIMFSFLGSIIISVYYDKYKHENKEDRLNKSLYFLNFLTVSLVVCSIATLLNFDYYFVGVLFPFLIYISKSKLQFSIIIFISAILLYGFSLYTIFTLISIIFIFLYDDKCNSSRLKYFFYIFYPLHFLILYILNNLNVF